MGERERECVVVSEGFGWALSGAFQAGAGETNLATVGCLRERMELSEGWSGREGGRAPEMMTYNKPSSLN